MLMERGNPRVPLQIPHFPVPWVVLGLGSTLHQPSNKTPIPTLHLSSHPAFEEFLVTPPSAPSLPRSPRALPWHRVPTLTLTGSITGST